LIGSEKKLAATLPRYYSEVLRPAKKTLAARKSLHEGKKWWELSEPVATWLAARQPRIVSQAFGKSGNFAFDERGAYAVVQGVGWCWNEGKPDKETLFAYLALLNSRTFERLLEAYCPRLQGGMFELYAKNVNRIPLPDLRDSSEALAGFGRSIHSGESIDLDALDAAAEAAYRQPGHGPRVAALVSTWLRDTEFDSTSEKFSHPAYKQIIELGEKAVPFLLAEMRDRPDQWSTALRTITGENPVPPEARGRLREIARSWVEWGRARGYQV
jgi:hypothetical protein